MAEEIKKNYVTGLTLYFCRFIQSNSNVMLSNPATNEVWGTGGRTADNYHVDMTEEGDSGHYTGTFNTGGAIAAGVYHVVVYYQTGVNPADSPTDVAIGEGEIYWDGTAEINIYTLSESDVAAIVAKLPDDYIMGSSVTTSMDDEINAIKANLGQVHTVDDESPGAGGGGGGASGIAEGC